MLGRDAEEGDEFGFEFSPGFRGAVARVGAPHECGVAGAGAEGDERRAEVAGGGDDRLQAGRAARPGPQVGIDHVVGAGDGGDPDAAGGACVADPGDVPG